MERIIKLNAVETSTPGGQLKMKINSSYLHQHLKPQKVSQHLNNVALITTQNDRYISEICQEANTNSLQQHFILPHFAKLDRSLATPLRTKSEQPPRKAKASHH